MKSSPEQVMTKSKGIVFDIKRFATHDGNGIRTTMFFKGCPLRCKWCHNPEGLKKQPQILYMENQCIHCQTCVHTSKNKGVEWVDGNIVIHRDIKDNWDEIVYMCPTTAICFDSKEYTFVAACDELFKDIAFFSYGGGVTFSGGEPFLQYEFMLSLLKECKRRNVHTAIESSFYTDLDIVKKVVPYLDQIYCDCKLFDEQKHIEYTGISNQKIRKNIEYLLTSEHKDKVIIRTPLIPTMSATEENIASISSFLSNLYPDVKYELLNYNPLAKSKYAYLDMEFCFKDNPELYTSSQMEEFYSIALKNGIKNLIKA
ncbi:MAG: glycyl-radical enzyme activating protein [Erysipelotrichaceae bacterium]|nr:glycyl-radical enzyme activating protein [Erysipelotrichaceae bacterium]